MCNEMTEYKDCLFVETFDEVHRSVAEYITSFVNRKAGLVSQAEFKVLNTDLTYESYGETTESFYGEITVLLENDGYALKYEVVGVFDEFDDVWVEELETVSIYYLD